MVEIINIEYIQEHAEDMLENSKSIVPFPIRKEIPIKQFNKL